MDCAEVRELLSSFNDREATLAEKAAVEEHLRTCKDCAFESTMIVGLKRLLDHWDGVRASQTFKSDLMEKVKQEPEPGPLSHVNWRPIAVGAGAAAGAAALIAVLWLVIPGSGGAGGAGTEGARTGETRAAGAPAGEGEIALPKRSGPRRDKAEPIAQVLVQEGTLRITRSDGVESLGSAGDVLAPGDSLKVSGRGEVELQIVGGLKLRLVSGASETAAGSERGVEFAIGVGPSEGELRSGTSVLIGAGEAREGEVFSVKTEPALVSFEKRDLLAQMALEGDGSLRVVVASGRAEAMLPAGVQVLNAGRTLCVAPDGKLASPTGPAEKETLERLRRWGKR